MDQFNILISIIFCLYCQSLFYNILLNSLLLIPLGGIFYIFSNDTYKSSDINKRTKLIGLTTSLLNLFVSIIIFILFDFSNNQFQFVQEQAEINYFDFYLGLDGLSIYFVLLTTLITPIALLSN
jgi:NADH-ubiquinone oxidoreductase chain 4